MEFKKVFFDVGANDGQSSIHIAENDGQCLVYAFEPTKNLCEELIKKTQHLKNYIVIPKAVSNFNGKSQFYVAGQADWGCSSLLKFSNKSKTEWPGRTDFLVTDEYTVDVIRLDDFIAENNITRIDYIHIDTQGSDLKVLEGLGEKISLVDGGMMEAANKDDILYYNQNNKKDSVFFLEKNGFKITKISPNDPDLNEVNITFKKSIIIKNNIKIKQFIVTYNNEEKINNNLKSIFESLSSEELSLLEINIINNHSKFSINDEFKDKVKIWHNMLRPDFSTGHLSRNWNQAIINGFVSILNPDCDILITCQDDIEYSKNYINYLINYHKTYSLIQVGKGDSFISYTIDSIKKIGLWDERFCTIGFQEMDYYIRAIKYNYEKTSINDFFHKKVFNPIESSDILKDTLSGYEREEVYHRNSEIYFHVCSHLLVKKWTNRWDELFINPDFRLELEPQISSFVFYPYFERYVDTLKDQKYVLQNDRIC